MALTDSLRLHLENQPSVMGECFPVNLLHIFRTPSLKNTSGGLLMHLTDSL